MIAETDERPSRRVPVVRLAALWAGLAGVAIAGLWWLRSSTIDADDPSVLVAAVLGVVEGLTEFLPVSSTGHLLVVQRVLGLDGDGDTAAWESFAIAIQFGAILAVVVLARRRLVQVVAGVRGRDRDGRRVLVALAAAFAPTAVAGLLLDDVVREHLFAVIPIAIAWIVGGLGILAWTRRPEAGGGDRPLEALTAGHAGLVGCAQVLALWPGTSRSLVTLVAMLALGYTIAAAVEFSFLLGLVTLTAATAWELVGNGGDLVDALGFAVPAVGFVAAFASALLAVRWMIAWVTQRGLVAFGWYRLAIGLATLMAVGVVS